MAKLFQDLRHDVRYVPLFFNGAGGYISPDIVRKYYLIGSYDANFIFPSQI